MGTKALIFEIVGVDRASHTFDKVSTAVKANTTNMEKLQKAGAMAGKALAIGLAGASIAAVSFTKNAIEDDAAQRKLALALKNTTGATDDQVASVEDWINKQGVALGVSDDQLRPALQRLAQATGDITKAQRLASIAMDVSAGTGKSLEAVTTAMAKAQNGNMGSLSRLGVRIKDATGHTLTFNQAVQQMSSTFKGQATAAANSTEGQFGRLQVQFDELKETIGYHLIPVALQLGQTLLVVVGFIGRHTTAIGTAVAAVAALLAVTWAVGVATKVWTALTTIAAVATKAMAAAQWLLNVALDANPIGLVVIAIAALVAGLILAYKHSDTFRAIVDKTFSFIGKVVPKVIGEVVNFVKSHWQLLVTLIGGPLALVVIQVVKHFDTIKRVATVAVGAVVDTAKGYARFAAAVIDKVGDVVSFFKKLPGKIMGFLSALPGQLAALGGQLVQGLVNGIQAGAGKVLSAVESLVNKIPKKIRELWGINSPAKVAIPLGEAIPEGVAVGMERATPKAEDAAKKLADKLKARLSTLMDSFKSLQSGVASNFAGNMFSASAQAAVLDENGNVVTPAQTVGQNLLSNLHSTSGSLSKLIPAFKTLKHWGWKPGILAALFQSGGPDLIIELANNQGEANEALGLFGGITKMSNRLGGLVATDVYGDQIDAAKNNLHGKGKKGKGADDTDARTGDTYNVTVNVPPNADTNAIARETVKMIKRYKREVNGNQELGIA